MSRAPRLMRRRLFRTVPILALALLGLLGAAASAAGPGHTFIREATGAPPATLEWSTNAGYGLSVEIGWRRWGARRAVGVGRTRYCLAPASVGVCTRYRRARILAFKRRGFVGPEGGEYRLYCRVSVRGHLDPADPDQVLTFGTKQNSEYPCD